MKILTLIFLVLFLSSPSWSETLSMDDLVERNDIYYKKFTNVPFTGEVSGIESGSFKNGKKVWTMPKIISQEDVFKFINLPSDLDQTPREILESDFKSMGTIPIRGGWGYTKDDSVIIDKDDSTVVKGIPFDGIGVEKIFVEKRTLEELIVFRPDGQKFNGIKWELLNQSLRGDDDKYFDIVNLP